MFAVILASLLPGLFWLWYFNRYDLREKEPLGMISLALLSGAAAILPALLWEAPFGKLLQEGGSPMLQFVFSFFIVGLGEELFKYSAVILSVFKSPQFNEPMDGIVYSIAAAIGFSTVENVFYISAFGWAVAPLRGTVSTLAHIAFSGLAGYFLGRAKFSENPRSELAKGLLLSSALHGSYDFFLISGLLPPYILIVSVFALHFLLLKLIERAVASSPFS